MRHPVARCLLTLAILFSTGNACFPYTIKGVIKNAAGCYYPRVSLEIINNIDGIYTTSSENLITSANIDSLGNFIITGNELPHDKRYYHNKYYGLNGDDLLKWLSAQGITFETQQKQVALKVLYDVQ